MRSAGLPLKAIQNMRTAERLPTVERFRDVAAALGAPEPQLLEAWLRDAGYRLPERSTQDDLVLNVMMLPPEARSIAHTLLRALRNHYVHRS